MKHRGTHSTKAQRIRLMDNAYQILWRIFKIGGPIGMTVLILAYNIGESPVAQHLAELLLSIPSIALAAAFLIEAHLDYRKARSTYHMFGAFVCGIMALLPGFVGVTLIVIAVQGLRSC